MLSDVKCQTLMTNKRQSSGAEFRRDQVQTYEPAVMYTDRVSNISSVGISGLDAAACSLCSLLRGKRRKLTTFVRVSPVRNIW